MLESILAAATWRKKVNQGTWTHHDHPLPYLRELSEVGSKNDSSPDDTWMS